MQARAGWQGSVTGAPEGGVESAVLVAESVVPDAEHFLRGGFDDLFEIVGRRARQIADLDLSL